MNTLIKTTFIFSLAFCVSFYTQAQSNGFTDTSWLNNKIIKNKVRFENKKLKVLLDTLNKYKKAIADYDPPSQNQYTILDTYKTKEIVIYFNNGSLDVEVQHLNSFFSNSDRNDTLKTHIPYITITFKRLVPFNSKLFDEDRFGLGSVRWNKKLAAFWGKEIVEKIEVGEY